MIDSINIGDSNLVRLTLAPGVCLSKLDAGTQTTSYLAQASDGKQFQLSSGLYLLLACLETPRTVQELAVEYCSRTGNSLNPSQLNQILTEVVVPKGLLAQSTFDIQTSLNHQKASKIYGKDDVSREARSDASILNIHFHRNVLPVSVLNPITKALSSFFNAAPVICLLPLVIAAHVIAYLQLGFPPKVDLIATPTILVFSLFMASIFLHELGHLSACRRWDCQHGAIGFGLYFLSPVLYADVSNAWRLTRWQRVCVDLGGFYFQLIFTIVLGITFCISGDVALLLVIVLIDISILSNLNPLAKLDGYWLLSDASGIPNLHKRVAEVIQNILFKFRRTKIGNRDNHFSFSNLRRSSAIALWVYAIVSVICWPLLIVMTLPALIQLLTNYPSDIGKDLAGVFVAIQQLDAISFGKHSLALFVPALLMLNLGLIAKYMLHRTLTLLAKFTQESLMHKNVNVKWFAFGAGTGSIGTIFIVALIGFFFLRPNGLLMGGLSEGTLAPEFVGSDLKSQSVRLSDYRGKTVVLKFWSPDCEPCRDDVATMKQAYQKLGGPTVAFITVSAHTSKTRTESFSTEQNIEYPVVIDEQGTIANLYNVTGIPFTYVIDANGKITSAKVGPRSMSELEKDILPCTNGACFSK